MFDARTFPSSLQSARQNLSQKKAEFRGEYIIHDVIFASKNPEQSLDKVFLRLRIVHKNIWNEKPIIVAIKNTEAKKIGKVSAIPLRKQFDTEREAREFIQKNYNDEFVFLFEFDRTGWQYDLGQDQVDLEDIEGNYSIEFKSPSLEDLEKLLSDFKIDPSAVIKTPSVVVVKNILKR